MATVQSTVAIHINSAPSFFNRDAVSLIVGRVLALEPRFFIQAKSECSVEGAFETDAASLTRNVISRNRGPSLETVAPASRIPSVKLSASARFSADRFGTLSSSAEPGLIGLKLVAMIVPGRRDPFQPQTLTPRYQRGQARLRPVHPCRSPERAEHHAAKDIVTFFGRSFASRALPIAPCRISSGSSVFYYKSAVGRRGRAIPFAGPPSTPPMASIPS